MAFVDDYSPINFVDLPNETTPIDAENLNKMDSQIKKLSTFASTTYPETTEDRLSGLEEKTNSLKEDLSNKITKFYASNQGETHLADSDNGKIQDMMIYGKSSQDGTPTPENPVEIKSVVNPTVKLLGSNILKIRDGEYQDVGCTITVSNGVIKLNGTSTDNKRIYLPIDTPSMLKEGTEIIFCPNNIGGTEHFKCYVDYSNENTKSFSIASNTINTPYVITRRDARYEFKLSIKITRGNTFNNETWKPQILIGKQITPFEPYKEQSIQLPITLNAIPVSSDGNYTDPTGQQWICDEVDLERGVKVQRVKTLVFSDNSAFSREDTSNGYRFSANANDLRPADTTTADSSAFCSALKLGKTDTTWTTTNVFTINIKIYVRFENITTLDELQQYLQQNPMTIIAILATPIETPLTLAELADFNAFITYYPVTNISVNSEQLDGYTVFNYPISIANGWNYVKQQLNDNRDYIYDMDTQSAEAYVNSEYAVALTELEV